MPSPRVLALRGAVIAIAVGALATATVAAGPRQLPVLGAPLAGQEIVLTADDKPGSELSYRDRSESAGDEQTLRFTVKDGGGKGRVFLFLDEEPGKLPSGDAEFIREMQPRGDRFEYTVKNRPALRDAAAVVHWTNRADTEQRPTRFHWVAARINCGDKKIRKPRSVNWKDCAFVSQPRSFIVRPSSAAATTPGG